MKVIQNLLKVVILVITTIQITKVKVPKIYDNIYNLLEFDIII